MPAAIEWFEKHLTDTDNRVLSVRSKNLDNFVHFQGGSYEASLEVEDENGQVFNMRCCKRKGKYKKPVMRGEWRRFFTLKELQTSDKVKFYKVNDEAAGAKYKIKVQRAQKLQGLEHPQDQSAESIGAAVQARSSERMPAGINHPQDQSAESTGAAVQARSSERMPVDIDLNYPPVPQKQDQSAESTEAAVRARSSERMPVDMDHNYPPVPQKQDQSAESAGAAVQASSSERMPVDIDLNYPPVPQKPSPEKLFGTFIYQ